MGLSELTPGPVSWNVEVFVQALKELVSAGTKDNDFIYVIRGWICGGKGSILSFWILSKVGNLPSSKL